VKPFSKILVPIDFSTHSDQAIEAALDIAKRYEASITLVNVFEPIALAFPEGSGIYASLSLADFMVDLEKELEKKRAATAAKSGRAIQAVQRTGHPPHEIVDLASSGGFDLIVMGTQGRTGLAHMLIGSVAERVVRTAPCAVLTVHRPR
jgi:nucleotide-binding universal stress UspA family protein